MELLRALAVLSEPPGHAGASRVAAALGLGGLPGAEEHTELFVFQLYPYASVYLGAEGMVGGEARDRIEGFWRALGLGPPAEADHLSVMLAAYARLAEMEESHSGERADWGGARRAFLWEHLLSWLPAYLDKLAEVAPPFYRRWGEILTGALMSEARGRGPAPVMLPLHLRAAPALSRPEEHGAEEFLRSLLAPARSGVILTRADLVRAARALGVGARPGGRAFTLKSLLSQDAPAVLAWLDAEADAWAARHAARRATLGATAAWWQGRARATAEILKQLRRDAAAGS
ncbi:MAG TPA: molecular chaperone TorD family protein [Pyrinomonadaceae bacterium]|nr:molecular chaperone TorD family protein [Pyrinomonadaceae bacterium]